MYEYRWTHLEYHGKSEGWYRVPYSHESLQQVLTNYGDAGWRLVAATGADSGGGTQQRGALTLFWERMKK